MRTAHFFAGVILLAACSSDLPHEGAYDPGSPLDKQAKASLSGIIRLEGESDYSQITVDLQNETRTYNVDTAADGSVRLTGVVPGSYTLSLRTRYFQAVTETLIVGLGESVNLGTRSLAPLRGRVLGLATSERSQGLPLTGGVSLSLKKTASIRAAIASAPAFRRSAAEFTTGPTLRTVSGIDGNYEFGEVPAGGYELTASTPETGELSLGDVTVTGEGDVTVDPIVLRPLTGYFEILGMANGEPSSSYTSVGNVNLRLNPSNATQVKVAVSTNGTTGGCDLAAAVPEALPGNSLRPLTLVGEGRKLVCVSFVDAAGKETEALSGAIMFDATAPILPSVQVNAGTAVVGSNVVTLQLSAVDVHSGIAGYKVHSVDNFGAVSAKPMQPTDVYSLAVTDGVYSVWVIFGDQAGNYSAPVSATVVLDTTPPVIGSYSLTKLDGAPLTTGDTIAEDRVKLVSSITEVNALEMQVTTNGGYAGQAWVPYDPSKIFDLSNAVSTIGIRVRDPAGHIVEVVTAFTLTTDMTPPSGTLDIAATAVTQPAITVQATGSIDAVEVELAFDPNFLTSLGRFTPGPIAILLPAGDGSKSVYGRFFDAAGNMSALVGDSVLLDMTPPAGPALAINGGAAFTSLAGVTLTLGGTGATEMQLSENAVFSGAAWTAFTTSYAYVMTGGEGERTIYLRLRDAAGNLSVTQSAAVVFDAQAPTGVSIAIVEQPTTRQSFVTLTLAASDATDLMLADDVSFTGRYWQSVTTTAQWSLPPGDGTKRVYVKYRDLAGNESEVASAATILDTTPPVAGSLMLNGGAAITNSTSIAYAISATDALSEPLQAQVSGEAGFGGAAWTSYGSSGTYSIAAGDGVRSLYVRFRDAVGNVSLAASGSFILDQAGPQLVSLVVNEGRAYTAGLVAIDFQVGNWAAGDALQVATAADFSGAVEYPSNAGVNRVTYSIAAPDGAKTVYARARDTLGNFGPAWSTAVTRDTVPPSVAGPKAIVIDGDADHTTTRFVNLGLNVSGAAEMLLWNAGQLLYATWEPFSASTAWSLPFGDGVQTVHARFRDSARNVIEPYSDMITLDTGAPTSPSLVINGGLSYVTSPTVSLALSAVGADTLQLGTDGVFDTEPSSPYDTSDTWTFSGAEGAKWLYARFCDKAGNCSQIVSASVVLDQTPPTGALSVNQGAARTAAGVVSLNLSASDGMSGLQGVKLANSFAALANTDVVAFEPTKLWTLAAPTGAGVESAKEIWLQAIDRAGLGSTPVRDEIIFDSLAPTGGLTLSAAVTRDTLIGVDLTYTADVTHAKVSAGNDCAGGNWVEAAHDNLFTVPNYDGVHDVSVRFRDEVGNESVCYSGSVVFDISGPTPGSLTVTGNAGANTGFSNTASLVINSSSGAVDCDGWEISEDVGFVTVPVAGSGCTITNLAYNLQDAGEGVHTLYLRYFDTLGNAGPVAARSVVLDTSGPVVSAAGFSVDQGAYVSQADITLTMLASGADAMSVAQGPSCSTSWVDYSANYPYSITGGEGAKTLRVLFRNDAGTLSDCYQRQVTLDTTAPVFSAAVTGSEGVPGRTALTVVWLTLSGLDVGEAAEMRVANVAGFAGATWQPTALKVAWSTLAGDGVKPIFVQARDAAGNVSDVLTPSIELDQTPPDAPSLQLLDVTGDGFALEANRVELTWSASGDPNLAAYDLERLVIGIDSAFGLRSSAAAGATTFSDGVTATTGVAHYYRIYARDDLGQRSAFSNIVVAQPFNAVNTAAWFRVGSETEFQVIPQQGLFSMQNTYSYLDDSLLTELTEPLPQNQLTWTHNAALGRFNETMRVRSANQDNSLVYDAAIPLPFDYQESISGTVGAVDLFGWRHQAFADSLGMVYGVNKGGGWTYTRITLPSYSSSVNPKMAFGPAGQVHLLLASGSISRLWYATNSTGSWVSETMTWDLALKSDLFVDANNKPHVAYAAWSTYPLKYANKVGASWVVANVGATAYGTVEIGVDNNGYAHIAYLNTSYRLVYANNTAGSWAFQLLSPGMATVGDLAIKPDGKPVIAWTEPGASLKLTTRPSGTWVTTTTTSLLNRNIVGLRTSAAGATDVVISGSQSLLHRWYGSWSTTTVCKCTTQFQHLSFDLFDRIHLVTQDAPKVWLQSSLSQVNPWFEETMPITNTGSFSMAVSGHSNAVVAYDGSGGFRVAERFDNRWVDNVADAVTQVDGYSSIVRDSAGKISVAYTDYANYNLKVASKPAGGSWSVSTPISTGSTGFVPGLAVDSSNFLYVTFQDMTTNRYRYGTNRTGAWAFADVDASRNVYAEQSGLLLNSGGRLFAFYQTGMDDTLRVGTKLTSGASFSLESISIVDNTLNAVGSTLDSAGVPHLFYIAGSRLRHSWRTGTAAWSTEDVGPTGTVLSATHDPVRDRLWLVVRRSDGAYLHFKDGSEWYDARTLTSAAGALTSLKFDTFGNGSVLYTSGSVYKYWYGQPGGTVSAAGAALAAPFE